MTILVAFVGMLVGLILVLAFQMRVTAEEAREGGLVVAGRSATLREAAYEELDTILWVGSTEARSRDWKIFDAGLKRSGQEDQRIGDRAFDKAWVLQGEGVTKLFEAERRAEVIAALTALRRFKDPRLRLGPDGLEIRVRHRMKGPDARRVLLRAAEVLIEARRALAEQPEAVVWLQVRENGPVLCQVCGSDIEAPPVLCRTCRTPHHEDCWGYARRCSTYGCGERRSVRA